MFMIPQLLQLPGTAARWITASLQTNRRRGLRRSPWQNLRSISSCTACTPSALVHSRLALTTSSSVSQHASFWLQLLGVQTSWRSFFSTEITPCCAVARNFFTLERDSLGIRWLCKVLSSSLSAMGFVAELPPFVSSTPAGLFECNLFMVYIEDVVVFKLQERMVDCRRCS